MSWRAWMVCERALGGRLRGESGDGADGRIAVLRFAAGISAGRDGADSAHRRVHAPLVVAKAAGPATPLLAQAACTGEALRSVVITCCRPVPGAQGEEPVLIVRLEDAHLAAHRLILPAAGDAPLEELEIAFRRIAWEHRPARTMAADAW